MLTLVLCSGMACLLPQADSTEPEYCKLLRPSALDRLALPEWLLGSGDILKQQGCWVSHSRLGEEVLARPDLREDLRGRLALSLASSAFYLGDYDRCLGLALSARQLVDNQKSPQRQLRARVESGYLRSAVARVRKQPEAVPLAEQALKMAKAEPDSDDFLVAKSLYNLGAALTDVEPVDLVRAYQAFVEAEKRFRFAGSQYDVVRSVIRQARVLYLQADYHGALNRLNSITDQLGRPRGKMLFYYQRAKIYKALKRWQDAKADIDIALELASMLGADQDQRRIRELLKSRH